MILGIGVVATLSKLRDYSHKINESHLLSTICTALHLRFETLLKVLFISLAILSVYWEEQICCTGNFSFEHFLLFLSFCKIVMFVFGVEVRLAVFCLKQHFETDRDRFKTSNLSYFQNSNVRRIIGLRVSQHIGAFVFTVFFIQSRNIQSNKAFALGLKPRRVHLEFQLYTIWPASWNRFSFSRPLLGGGRESQPIGNSV